MSEEKLKNDALPELSSDDRAFAALAWLQILGLWPWVSLLLLIAPTTKDRPFVRYNAILSLLTTVAMIPVICLTVGCGAVLFVVYFYWAYQAFLGQWVEVPVLSRWLREQRLA